MIAACQQHTLQYTYLYTDTKGTKNIEAHYLKDNFGMRCFFEFGYKNT